MQTLFESLSSVEESLAVQMYSFMTQDDKKHTDQGLAERDMSNVMS